MRMGRLWRFAASSGIRMQAFDYSLDTTTENFRKPSGEQSEHPFHRMAFPVQDTGILSILRSMTVMTRLV
jgi:hypothetical protein